MAHLSSRHRSQLRLLLLLPILMGFTLVTGTGCVSQGTTDSLQTKLREKENQIVELLDEKERLQLRVDELLRQQGDSRAMQAELSRLQSEIDSLNQQLADARAALEAAGRPQIVEVPINQEVASALEQLAAANPGLMTFDAQRGMIRLQSDLTFGSGSIDLSDNAASALRQLAGVLASPAAQPYDIRVVGHTDNVAVRSLPGRRFQNNWELSVFRAIAVKNELSGAGVAETRVEVAGRADTQPVVANQTNGAEPNRRVEIFLVQSASPAPAAPASNSQAPASQAPAAAPAPAIDPGYDPDAEFK